VTWKGRTFYLFFLWLAFLEIILRWEKLQTYRVGKIKSLRTILFVLALTLPTIYVITANFYGLNRAIVDWTWRNNVAQCDWMPLAIEYLVFAALFTVIIFLEYGCEGLKNILLSPVFLIIIGTLYTIDNVYPYGGFTPFQILVPTTANLAARILSMMGCKTSMTILTAPKYGTIPILTVTNPQGKSATFGIAWPCSGIESLIIYTLTILLFLRNINTSWKHKTAYFIIGAIVTYLINVMRIVIIFIIAMNSGVDSIQTHRFHDYYGQLYSIIWIIIYPILIIGSRALWAKIKKPKENSDSQNLGTMH
jgi:thaumarchaeosortase